MIYKPSIKIFDKIVNYIAKMDQDGSALEINALT